MFFTQDRIRLRNFYLEVFEKVQTDQPLEPLEALVADVIKEHPEYHHLFKAGNAVLDNDFSPEDGQINPWLHISMHVALREQVSTDRPKGIVDITRSLLLKHQDGHDVEHMMFECLGKVLWVAQRDNRQPDDAAYLNCLQRL